MKHLTMRGYHRSVVLLIGLAFVAGTALAQPKKPAKPAPKPAPTSKGSGSGSAAGSAEGEVEMGVGDDKAAPAGGSGSAAAPGEPGEIDMSQPEDKPADLSADMAAAEQQQVVTAGPVRRTPLSWSDIVVVVRKPFLKLHRTELYPFVGTTMNDNMIRHYSVGGELAYYLSDTLAVGVEGNYFVHQFREPFDLVARQARRLPTVNQYNWSAALNFHYVPVYGKFAIFDHRLVAWEVALTAGIGAGQSEVIPRDNHFQPFTNFLIMPNVGGNMRFFLTKFATINVGIRDYAFIDKYEPVMRVLGGVNDSAEDAKAHADAKLVNNVMFQIGISFWIPTSFEYTTFR
jgi:outer membrane beta-barrel protein